MNRPESLSMQGGVIPNRQSFLNRLTHPITRRALAIVTGIAVSPAAYIPLETADIAEAKAALSGEQQYTYSSVTGNYPDYEAVEVDRANSDYSKSGSPNDGLGYAYRNCTAYAAWRAVEEGLVDSQAISFWSDGGKWDEAALKHGFTPDRTPEVGDIAQWVCKVRPCSPTMSLIERKIERIVMLWPSQLLV